MRASLGFVKFKLCSSKNHVMTMINKILKHLFQSQDFWPIIDQGQDNDAKCGLHLRMHVQLIQNHLWVKIRFEVGVLQSPTNSISERNPKRNTICVIIYSIPEKSFDSKSKIYLGTAKLKFGLLPKYFSGILYLQEFVDDSHKIRKICYDSDDG